MQRIDVNFSSEPAWPFYLQPLKTELVGIQKSVFNQILFLLVIYLSL